MAPSATPNGDAQAATSNLPPVVGINFGNTYASVAVYTKEGIAECIANENGERQIACAIAFHGEEIYIGNQALPQLVKNSQNTIAGFRNLLGKKFSEIDQSQKSESAPVIQHPTEPDTPAYKVDVLQPAPSPLPTSAANTPAASNAATPRSEPVPSTRILTPEEVTTMFLAYLLKVASDFLGKPLQGAVITSPPSFTPAQKDALKKAAESADVRVLQLLDESSAALCTTTCPQWPAGAEDRTQLVVDVGASSLSLSVIALRSGLGYILGSKTVVDGTKLGGSALSAALVKHFSKEFTKKTKTELPQPPSSKEDIRATSKLLLAIEYTKRTLSASSTPASISVESLHSGLDFTATIARMRFDLLAAPVYNAISSEIKSLLETIPLDPHDIDEIAYVGGTGCLPGLDSHLLSSVGFSEDVQTPFSNGTMGSGAIGDPTGVLSIGCAIQASLLFGLSEDVPELAQAFEGAAQVKTTTRTIGIVFPTAEGGLDGMGGFYIPVLHKHTPLPARRIFQVEELALAGGEGDKAKKFAFEVWEVEEGVKVDKIMPPKRDPEDGEDEDEDEEDEPEEVKTKTVSKTNFLGAVQGETKGVKDKSKKGAFSASLQIELVLAVDGALSVSVSDSKGEKSIMSVRLSLAEQIAQLQEPAPVDLDPEDVQAGLDAQDILVDDNAREHYVDVGNLRRLQSVADPKYAGVKISRDQLKERELDSAGEDFSDDQDSFHTLESPVGHEDESNGDGDGPVGEEDGDEDIEEDEDEDGTGGDQEDDEDAMNEDPSNLKPLPTPPAPQDTVNTSEGALSSTLQKTRAEDRKKGQAVTQQIAIWDALLDARIRLQKSATCANRLPSSANIKRYEEIPECRSALNKMLDEAFALSDDLFSLQEKLVSANEVVSLPARKRRKLDLEGTLDEYSTLLNDAAAHAANIEHAIHPHTVQTLSKWSSKIQAVAPAALMASSRTAFSSRNSQNLKSAVQLIDETLLDHRKLVARTQARRNNTLRIGEVAGLDGEEDVDIECFDDNDFYQQLLKDIIDSRGSGDSGADHWQVVQKQKKAKKTVDTKASKGRKLRYEAHEKLQHFMVPVPVPGMWHDEQIDELFSSLMGRGLENALGNINLDAPAAEILQGGFKVFG
ncbi:unnamed protein product [Mycena citricolor]|uniref:Protein BFR2 n=1 Tax=Mycena citricolor TaxID=2018698 RepID=A0AAD2HGW2_9AGAR|nr:unnamed protein product [Mycena citricolor]